MIKLDELTSLARDRSPEKKKKALFLPLYTLGIHIGPPTLAASQILAVDGVGVGAIKESAGIQIFIANGRHKRAVERVGSRFGGVVQDAVRGAAVFRGVGSGLDFEFLDAVGADHAHLRIVGADGVEEFKVQTGAYSAEYGRTSNGILNYTTKSGTNDFHGSLMATIRNEHLNAGGFFWDAHTPPSSARICAAASIGGPIWIPKLYNGRNKAFFFFTGERSRAKDVSSSSLITLPIDDFRKGDFRRYTNANGVVPLYDPFDASGKIIADANQRPRMQCNGVLNVICPDRISPIAQRSRNICRCPTVRTRSSTTRSRALTAAGRRARTRASIQSRATTISAKNCA